MYIYKNSYFLLMLMILLSNMMNYTISYIYIYIYIYIYKIIEQNKFKMSIILLITF